MLPKINKAGSLAAARAHAGTFACAIIGLAGGWYGLVFGLLIGTMLDIARLEAAQRSRIAAFFASPSTTCCGLTEPIAGLAAASCLALRGEWPGLADSAVRRGLWDRFVESALPPGSGPRRDAERIADLASHGAKADIPGLARSIALSDSQRSRELLARWAFALAALGGRRLGAGEELSLRAALGDCGLGSEEIREARALAFPNERDPWTVLGLAPGSPYSETKRAYRRLSRAFHPDLSPEPDAAERFRELQEAFEALAEKEVPRSLL
jgi:DnaJ-class molecular chaperone with C-terminal Zn finger domain